MQRLKRLEARPNRKAMDLLAEHRGRCAAAARSSYALLRAATLDEAKPVPAA